MNSFQRKSLYAALAGLGALSAVGTADAVNVNPNGLGQVLLYPYYTVRTDSKGDSYNTLLSVVNTTNSAMAVKVRLLESLNSQEVIDFNLFLSPYDVWTAALIPSPSTSGGRLLTVDKSCTLPPIGTNQGGPGYVDFVNFAYVGDSGGDSLDRSKEGYVEIIEMATFASGTTTAKAVTHVAGVPPGCKGGVTTVTDTQASTDASAPLESALMGGISLINVDEGTDYTSEPTVLDNFYPAVVTVGCATISLYANAGSVLPNLTKVCPANAVVFDTANNRVLQSLASGWTAPVDAVSAVLMHNNVLNEYVLDAATLSGTDWLMTFPTKQSYLNFPATGSALYLFESNFNNGSCDEVSLQIYDREEDTTSTPLNFSPPPPQGKNTLCWEANVVTFNNTNVLASAKSQNISTGFSNGWLQLGFFPANSGVTGNVHHLINTNTTITNVAAGTNTTAQTETYLGLPVIGFQVQSFTDGTLVVGGVNVLSNYGGNFLHKTTTSILP